MAEIDLKRVTPLEWAGVGGGALAFIVSFFPWASVDIAGFGSVTGSAWNSGFLAWFSVLLLVGAGVVVALPHLGVQVDRRPLIWLVLSGLATLFIIIRWLTLDAGFSGAGLLSDSIDVGAGFGLIVGLIVAIASTVAAVMTFRAAPTTAPGANPAATA
jgi:hypothetical protein